MKEYDWLMAYPSSMAAGRTLILHNDVDFGWFEDNLLKTTPYYQSDYTDTEQTFVCNIVGYVTTPADSESRAVCFDDKANYRLLLEQKPEWVIEQNPFRPDPVTVIQVTVDGKQMSRWEHLKAAFKF